MSDKRTKKSRLQRVSSLILLVVLIFVILFISIGLSVFITEFLIKINVFPPLVQSRLQVFSAFILIVSLFIGTILAILGGDYFLSPLQQLTDATKKIAEGDFDVHVKARGTRELSILADSFNKMAKELSSVEHLRDDFVSNISHEYKTPIVSIRGFARQLKKNSLTSEQREQYLDIIISESERLVNLSSNVLLLSKIENSGEYIVQSEFSLDEQIRRAILVLEPQITKKNIEADIVLEPVMLVANEELLHHVWLNILDNAVKFSPDFGKIKVSLSLEDNIALVTISDSGPGLSADAKQHMFDKFYQDDSSRASVGNGLGLSLCKKIVELNGGKITADNNADGGAVFTIKLPVQL